MADANFPTRPLPADWNDAFGTLPLERPPGDAWARLAAALPAASPAASTPVRGNRMAWPAMAAVASVAIALPLAWWLAASPEVAMPQPKPPAHVATMPANTPPADLASTQPTSPTASASPVDAASATAGTRPTVDRRKAREPRRKGETSTGVASAIAASIAGAQVSDIEATTAGQDASLLAANAPSPDETRLDALRQQSARLEALVAYARDDRMTSATAAVMSASLDDRIRLIDAALMQPSLGDDLRASLWDQRVGTLQELAALEGTQRWMAVHGASMDAVARVD